MKPLVIPTELEKIRYYEICVLGRLHERWSNSFDGMTITVQEIDGAPTITVLSGPIVDQPALRSILCRLWDLNLTVISVSLQDMESC
jgi:hypothetical protein